MTTATPKYATKRARIHLEEYGTGVLSDLFNVDSLQVSANETTIKKKSTNENAGTLAEETTDTELMGDMVLGSTDFDNFVRTLRAIESAQAAVANGTFTLAIGAKGSSMKLPHANISALSLTGLVRGVDYDYYKSSGIVIRLKDMTATAAGTYSAGTARVAGIGAADAKYYTIHITDERGSEYTQFFKARIKLPTAVQFISADAFATFPCAFTLFQDESRPARGDLGQYGMKVSA